MAAANYKAFIDRVIQRYEGGYGWDSGDPGGPTKYGITCYDLAEHRGQKMTSMSAWAPIVRAMGLDEAEAIYKTKYAGFVHFDELPSGADCVCLDYGINSGNGRVGLVANSLVGLHGSVFTAATVKAIQTTDVNRFITNMDQERLRFLHAIRGGAMWQKFGRGWGARVADLDTYSHHLAAGKPASTAPAAPDLSNVPTPKGVVVPTTGKTITGGVVGGAAAGGASVAAGAPHWLAGTLIGVAVVGAVGYGIYQGYQDLQANKVHV